MGGVGGGGRDQSHHLMYLGRFNLSLGAFPLGEFIGFGTGENRWRNDEWGGVKKIRLVSKAVAKGSNDQGVKVGYVCRFQRGVYGGLG